MSLLSRIIPNEQLNTIRLGYQKMPSIGYLFSKKTTKHADSMKTLRENGIVKLEGFIKPAELEIIQREFEQMITGIYDRTNGKPVDKYGFIEEFYNPDSKIIGTNNPFQYSEMLIKLCIDPNLREIINNYLKKQSYIQQGIGARYLPHDFNAGSFQWHHDAWGKRINVMFLLSDVGEEDQCMTYLLGSHNINHGYEEFSNSRIGIDYCQRKIGRADIIKATGKAGDIFVFDSNGLHSGNRTMTKSRDTFIINYSGDRSYTWGLKIPQEFTKGYSQEELRPFERIVKHNSKSSDFFPKYKSWVESLPHISSWI